MRNLKAEELENIRVMHWNGLTTDEIGRHTQLLQVEVELAILLAYGVPDEQNEPTPNQLRDRAARERAMWSDQDRKLRAIRQPATINHCLNGIGFTKAPALS